MVLCFDYLVPLYRLIVLIVESSPIQEPTSKFEF